MKLFLFAVIGACAWLIWESFAWAVGPSSMPADPGGLAGWIWDAFAGGQLALAVGGLCTLLVRALDAKVIKDRIPKKHLKWVGVASGVLSQGGGALLLGVAWQKALLMGAVAGVTAVGLWETVGKSTPGIRKKKEQ